ncbi:MAG: hypothetical protein R3E96_07480 [Planctomycetota bacterium]
MSLQTAQTVCHSGSRSTASSRRPELPLSTLFDLVDWCRHTSPI